MFAVISTRSTPFPSAISKMGAIVALAVSGTILLLLAIALGILIMTHNCCKRQQTENEDEDDTLAEITNALAQYELAAAVPPPAPRLALLPLRPAATNV
jgi:high-affinity nickel permease